MSRALVILLGLSLLIASATAVCDALVICKSAGETGCESSANVCRGGTYCSIDGTTHVGTCTSAPRVGESCVSSGGRDLPCYDPNLYSLVCDETCKYAGIYLPGEKCAGSNSSFFNGGCVYGICEDDGKCTSYALNEICYDPNNGTYETLPCAAGLYCNTEQYPGRCTSLPSLGEECNGRCASGLVCSYRSRYVGTDPIDPSSSSSSYYERTCVETFSKTLGGDCGAAEECEPGLYCNSYRQCVRPSHHGEECSSGSCIASGYSCACTQEVDNGMLQQTGAKCLHPLAYTQEQADAIKDLEACLKADAQCFSLLEMRRLYGRNWGPDSCLARCVASTGFTLQSFPWRTLDSYDAYDYSSSSSDDDDGPFRNLLNSPSSILSGLPLNECFFQPPSYSAMSMSLIPMIAVLSATLLALFM